MPAPGVIIRESEGAASGARRPGDVSTGAFAGPALRGPADRVIEIRSAGELDDLVGAAYGGSHVRRSLERFFADGGTRAFLSRAVDATAATAKADIPGPASSVVLKAEADGPGAFGNSIKVKFEAGSTTDRRIATVTDNGRVRRRVEVGSTAEAIARLAVPGAVKFAAGAGAWPPTSTETTLTGGVAADSAVTAANVVTAIGRIPRSVGPCTLMAPGVTDQTVHEALARLARERGWFANLDLPNISVTSTLLTAAAGLRALDDEKSGRYCRVLWPWEVVPIGPWVNVEVPPSAGQAGRDARADREDPQRQGRAAAGPEYTAVDAVDVTFTPTETDADLLADAGVTLIRREPEGVCAWDAVTLASPDRWLQYLFATGARTRMAIVDESRTAVRPHLFRALDGDGVQLEVIRGAVVAVCQPYLTRGQLFSEDGDGGYAVAIVSTADDLAQGRVRVRLSLRTSPGTRHVVIEFTSAAVGGQL